MRIASAPRALLIATVVASLVQAQYGIDYRVNHARRKPDRRLIHQQKLRSRHQGAADGELGLLAAAETPGRPPLHLRRTSQRP